MIRKGNFLGGMRGVRTHFRHFFQIFLKKSKKLEHFSYLYQTHSLSRCEVMRNWKLMKSAWNVPSFCPWMVKKQAKSRKWPKNGQKLPKLQKNFSGKNNNFYKKLDRNLQKLSKKSIFAFCEVARSLWLTLVGSWDDKFWNVGWDARDGVGWKKEWDKMDLGEP